ncbi:MAG: DUF998 domain-containing protein [Thermoplasmata archaeon]
MTSDKMHNTNKIHAMFSIFGMIGPILIISSMLISIYLSEWWSFTGNALSDLGVDDKVGWLFNSGLVIGGFLILLFMSSFTLDIIKNRFIPEFPNRLSAKIGSLLICISSIPLMGVGLITEDAGMIHTYDATAFYVLAMLGEIVIGYSLINEKKYRLLGIFSVISAVIGFGVWALPWEGIAIPEIIGAVPVFTIVIIFATLRYNANTL